MGVKNRDERMLFPVKELVEAELVVKTPRGTRPPTREDLLACRLKDDELLYRRRVEIMRGLFGQDYNEETEEHASGIRYMLEYASTYANLELPDEALTTLRLLLRAAAPEAPAAQGQETS